MFYLDAKEVIPPFGEVTGEVPSGLSDNLHANVVPRHPRHLAPIIHILFGFVQSVEVCNPTIAIVLACKIQRLVPPQTRYKTHGLTRPNLFTDFEV